MSDPTQAEQNRRFELHEIIFETDTPVGKLFGVVCKICGAK